MSTPETRRTPVKPSRRSERDFPRLVRVKLPAVLWQASWLRHKPLPRQRVMMFHIGRSGSTVLADLLEQHPDVTWKGEYIRKFYAALDQRGLERFSLPADPERLLLDVMAGVQTTYFGVETKFFHLAQLGTSLEAYLDTLARMNFFHLIVLERRNYIRKIVSSVVARKRRMYRQPRGTPAELTRIVLQPEKVRIDRTEASLIELLDGYARDFERLRRLLQGRNALYLTYEDDLLVDPLAGYRRIGAYLGLAPSAVQVRFGRSNPFPLESILQNYGQVAEVLKGTPYEWMMDDDRGN